jgi:hypothetical protein
MAERVVLSWDTLIALVATIITFFVMPDFIGLDFVSSVYEIGISVLSIIFSIFFASLAIVSSLSDSEFVKFLEEKNDYTLLLKTFKFTLAALFVSLCYSIVVYIMTRYHLSNGYVVQSKWFFVVFEFMFIYSMISTALSVKDTLMFSKLRILFLNQKNKKNTP